MRIPCMLGKTEIVFDNNNIVKFKVFYSIPNKIVYRYYFRDSKRNKYVFIMKGEA